MRPDAAIRHDISQAGPFTSKAEGSTMPKSRRYPITELPGTLQRSCREAQQTFLRALDDAIRAHGAGDQAHRIAYLALKQKFEKRGDHWIAKDNHSDCGGGGKADQLAAHRNSSGQQIQRPAS
jgi:ChaB